MKKSMKILVLFSLLLISFNVMADKRKEFIRKYKHIAIREMERTGIPASITLAQGILDGRPPAPQAGHLRPAARAARHRTIPHPRDRRGIRRGRIGQRSPPLQLRLGAFDPPPVRRGRHSLRFPPNRRAACQGRTPLPHPPPVPAFAGPQGRDRLQGKAMR